MNSPRNPGGDDLDRRRLELIATQAATLRWEIVAVATIVAALVWQFVPKPWTGVWLVSVISVRELRAMRLVAMSRSQVKDMKGKLAEVTCWNALMGIVNGSAAVFMIWLDLTYDAVLTMIIASWAAGAVSSSAAFLRAYLVFASFVFIPVAAIWVMEGTPLSIGIAVLTLMFFGVQFRFAKQNSATFDESFRIRSENEALLQELSGKQQALTAAKEAAERANMSKSRFLAAASHDLRQPLHALTLHSGLLARDPNTPEAGRIAKDMATSIDSLASLLDSLLDISKLDAGVVSVRERHIRLDRLLSNLVRVHSPEASAKGLNIILECPTDVIVRTDPILLERIVRNLLDNAVKYTDRGEVRIRVTGEEVLTLSMRDTGSGIPESAREKVFEEFFQLDNPERSRQKGLGLGLAIVRRLSKLLALPIELNSVQGEGTTVSITLTRERLSVDEAPSNPASFEHLIGLVVLLVDDEETIRRAMRFALDSFGCMSVEASNGDEALAMAAAHPPDLVLADYSLRAGESGINVIQRLRQTRPDLPALLVSGDTDPNRLREAELSDVVLIHKPVAIDQLRVALAAAVQANEE